MNDMKAPRHGFAARGILLFTDSKEEFDKYRQSYIETFQPANFLELEILDEMIFAKWQIMRSQSLYTAALDNCMFSHREKLIKQSPDLSNTDITAQCARILHETDEYARNAELFQTRQHRIYHRYLKLLMDLQRARLDGTGPVLNPDITHKEEPNDTNLVKHAWDHVPFEKRPRYVREAANKKMQNELGPDPRHRPKAA